MYAQGEVTVRIDSCSFTDNSAVFGGGVVGA